MKRGTIVMFRQGAGAQPDDDRQVGLVTSLGFVNNDHGIAQRIAWVLWPGRRWPMALRCIALEVVSE